MIVGKVMVPGLSLQCEACGYPWVSTAKELPECCPDKGCRSREWNGPKKRVRKAKVRIELPKPKRVKWEAEDEF